MPKLAISVLQDGPLKISGAESIRYCGEALSVEGDAYLCRCGESASKPFCDGTHKKVGFSGANQAPQKPELRVWEGRSLRTYFNSKTCMHVFKCEPLAALREAELSGDDEAAKEIVRVVSACPSGALTYEAKDSALEVADAAPECDVDIIEGGEVRLQVEFEIDVELHERQRAARATLCRCGLSKNKPFCDGRHRQRKDFR